MNLEHFTQKYSNKVHLLLPENTLIRKKINKTDEWIKRVAKTGGRINPKIKLKKTRFFQWLEEQIQKSTDPLHEWTHARRVTKLMKLIAKEEKIIHKISRQSLHAAGLGHDIGRSDFFSTWTPWIVLKSLTDEAHSIKKIRAFFAKHKQKSIPKRFEKALKAIKGTSTFHLFGRNKKDNREEVRLLTMLIADADTLEMISKARLAFGMHRREQSKDQKYFIDTSKNLALRLLFPRIESSLHFEASKEIYKILAFESAKFLEEVAPNEHNEFVQRLKINQLFG